MSEPDKAVRHVLGISGGRDSAALAVFMKRERPEIPVEYFFTDTGSELPEVYEYLSRLESYLGRVIVRLNPEKQFKEWLREYKNFLPSVQQRWCTRQLKLRPFEDWIAPTLASGGHVISYVAIRSDEDRSGYRADSTGIDVVFPLREAGMDKAAVIRLLRDAGLDLPDYYRWRSRSGCTFCFFQQKIEWIRLREEHPTEFEKAKALEKTALAHGSPFTWSQGESLEELARPEREAQIRADFERRVERSKRAARDAWRLSPFADDTFTDEKIDEIMDLDDIYGRAEVASSCVICHK